MNLCFFKEQGDKGKEPLSFYLSWVEGDADNSDLQIHEHKAIVYSSESGGSSESSVYVFHVWCHVNVVCRATAIAHSLLRLFLRCPQRYLQRLQIGLQELQFVAKACHQRICTINGRQVTELVVYLVHSFCEHTVAQVLMQPDSIHPFPKNNPSPKSCPQVCLSARLCECYFAIKINNPDCPNFCRTKLRIDDSNGLVSFLYIWCWWWCSKIHVCKSQTPPLHLDLFLSKSISRISEHKQKHLRFYYPKRMGPNLSHLYTFL